MTGSCLNWLGNMIATMVANESIAVDCLGLSTKTCSTTEAVTSWLMFCQQHIRVFAFHHGKYIVGYWVVWSNTQIYNHLSKTYCGFKSRHSSLCNVEVFIMTSHLKRQWWGILLWKKSSPEVKSLSKPLEPQAKSNHQKIGWSSIQYEHIQNIITLCNNLDRSQGQALAAMRDHF